MTSAIILSSCSSLTGAISAAASREPVSKHGILVHNLLQSALLNLIKKYTCILVELVGVEFGLAFFNMGSQWSVCRGDGRIKRVG